MDTLPTGTPEEPRESFERAVAKWTPKQLEANHAAATHTFTLYGGSRGPGKSYWLRWWLLRFLIKTYQELELVGVRVGLFCESYPVLRDRQISKISIEFPSWLGELKDTQDGGLGFYLHPEYGSGVLALRNLDDPAKYQSAEFAAVGVDELTKLPLATFNILRGSMRWPGISFPRFVSATNPGGIGHLWAKAYFVDRVYPPELQPWADEFAFVRALPTDNPHLDPSYWQMLLTLPPDLAAAWVAGSWDVFEGMAFRHWNRARHVVANFDLPPHWPRWRAVDWGRRNPFCCLWLASDPDTGRTFVYRELYQTDLADRQQARAILANTPPDERINITYADPSMWTKKTFEETTFSTADEYGAEKVYLTKADNDRMTGKRKVDQLLMDLPDGRPGLMVFETCANLIRTLPGLPYDETNVEDVDSSSEDHAYDALRYGLTNVNPRPRMMAPPGYTLNDPLFARVPALQQIASSLAGGMRSRDL